MEEGHVGVSVLLPPREALLPSPVSTGETFFFDGAESELRGEGAPPTSVVRTHVRYGTVG